MNLANQDHKLTVAAAVILCALVCSSSRAVTTSHRQPDQPVSYGNVLISFQGLSTSQKNTAQVGYGKWNNNGCNGSDGAAPYLTETVGTGDPPGSYIGLKIVLKSGFADDQSKCGEQFGSTVNIYEKAKKPGGQTFFCTQLDIFEHVVQHEIGHFFGLKDGCDGVMNLVTHTPATGQYVNRQLHAAECSKVKSTHYTPKEALEDECDGGNTQSCEDLNPCEPPDNCSPVVIDLGGEGIFFSDVRNGVMFDIDSDGVPEQTSWTDRRSSANVFLALDRNGNGRIDNASELFGDSTPLRSGEEARNGFDALFELEFFEGNGNGFLENKDAPYKRILVWHDRNHNGVSEADELQSLEQAGVEALSLSYDIEHVRDGNDNLLLYHSWAIVNRHGERKRVPTVDVFFQKQDLLPK